MNNKTEKYLPIGTVVLLKNATKRLMITGFCIVSKDEKDKIYDYAGCLYPEGVLSNEKAALFNHDQIETIDYMGLIDEEEQKFKKELNSVMSKVNSMQQVPKEQDAAQPEIQE